MPTPKSLKVALALTKRESAFGTAIADAALLDMLKMNDINFAEVETEYRDDADEITGFAGPTEHEPESKRGSVSRKFKASLENIGWALALKLGRVTTSGTNPDFTHDIQWPLICTLNPFSTSLIEGLDCAGATATFVLYKGVVFGKWGLEINGKSTLIETVELQHDGSETAKGSFVFPAAFTTENKLLGNMTTLKFGPVGNEDISSLLRTLKLGIDSGINEPPSVTGGLFVAEYQYGDGKPDISVEFSLKGDKSHAIYGYYQNNTVVKFDLLVQKSATRSFRLLCSKGVCKVKEEPQGSETRLNVTFMPEWNSTDGGPGKFTVKNGVASYLNP